MTDEEIRVFNSQFELSKEQIEKFLKWKEELPHAYFGCDNDGIIIEFPQCSLGIIVKARRKDGHEVDLTDWDNF